MKILHIAETIRGGPATVLNEVVPLQQAEYGENSVLVVVPAQQVQDLQRIPRSSISTFSRPSRISGFPALLAETWKAVSEFQPDIIHLHSTFAGSLRPLLRATHRRSSIVYCAHGWAFDRDAPRAIQMVMKWTELLFANACDMIVAVSEFDRQGVIDGVRPDKLVVIENGIAPVPPSSQLIEWYDHRLRVLFIGRLDRQKGVDLLIKAAAVLSDQISVRIAGSSVIDGGGDPALPDNMEILGWLAPEEIESQMAACDVVVMPSRWEGCPLVAIEAMRASKPLIATRVGGLASMVLDGVTGVLIPREDVVALTEALSSRSVQQWAEMGRCGRNHFLQHYTVDRMYRGLADVYDSVLRRRRSRIP